MGALGRVMKNHTTIGFNNHGFDEYLVSEAIRGADCERLKHIANEIIKSNLPNYRVAKDLGINVPGAWDGIDLIDLAPGIASLKMYGARMGEAKLQDLPIEHGASITKGQQVDLIAYCRNDINVTRALYNELLPQIELRQHMGEEYGIDLRSQGGAAVAKSVIRSQLESAGVSADKPEVNTDATFKYTVPDFIHFDAPVLNDLLAKVRRARFTLNGAGHVKMPKELDEAITFDGASYKFGIGGLHSQEAKQSVIAGDDCILAERDVASMYPSIILNQNLHPKHLGHKFTGIYRRMVTDRLRAKHSGDKPTADGLKLTINSSFGLFGNRYSFTYSPDLLIATTVTGQLALLMLIEATVAAGARVVSANTDGVVSLCPKGCYDALEVVCMEWELQTGLMLEETRYSALHSKSVNSYVAITTDGKAKRKGFFAAAGLAKNPEFSVITDAVVQLALDGTPVEQTIRACDDPKMFAMVRRVNGGSTFNGEALGRVARYYMTTDINPDNCLRYATNGNKVPRSDGCKPMMTLPQSMPDDVDFDRYIHVAKAETKWMLV